MTWRRTTDAQGKLIVCGDVTIRPASFAGFVAVTRFGREAVVAPEAMREWANVYGFTTPSSADLAWVTA